jgi:hypothetical protein
MKTTIDIADDLLGQVRRFSQERNATLREVVSEGLRQLMERETSGRPFHAKPVTFRGDGLSPEFRRAAWRTLRAAAYEGRGA